MGDEVLKIWVYIHRTNILCSRKELEGFISSSHKYDDSFRICGSLVHAIIRYEKNPSWWRECNIRCLYDRG